MDAQHRKQLGHPLRLVDHQSLVLLEHETGVGAKTRLVPKILEIEPRPIGERKASQGGLTNLPRAQNGRCGKTVSQPVKAPGSDSRSSHNVKNRSF
jgi:hypothetical protein